MSSAPTLSGQMEDESGSSVSSDSEDDVQEIQPGDAAVGANNFVFRRSNIQAKDRPRLFAKTKKAYAKIIQRQADATDSRDGRENIIVHERLLSIMPKVTAAKTLQEIKRVHKRHSKDALVTAHEMLSRELTEFEKCAKRTMNMNARSKMVRLFLRPQQGIIRDIESSMEWCNKLELDIEDELQRRRAIRIPDDE
ncbi:hypothetical protein Q7P37_006793 [Cladosporium fusiforme]